MANREKYAQLFLSTFKLSACTFGGGFVIVPLIRKRFVEELGWLDEQEALDLTAIAQSAPGPIAVNASILLGYRVAGIPGAMLTALGTVLPPLIIISIISLFYKAFRDSEAVSRVMAGMLCGAAAVILDTVTGMAYGIFKSKAVVPIVVLIGSFIAVRFFGVNIILVILAGGMLGALETVRNRRDGKEAGK